MGNFIDDGTGRGYSTKVDASNRIHTGSVIRSERDAAIQDGRFFITNSTLLTLTDDVETPILYIKNNDDRALYLDLFDIYVGTSSGGTGDTLVKTYGFVGATSTIVTEEKAALVGNANQASPEIFNGDVFRGETGDTLVGAVNFNNIILKSATDRFSIATSATLPKGSTGAFSVTAPSGNTSMQVSLLFFVYYVDTNLPK